ncbi:GATA zinc finger domain-containing protein 14 [Condylostylus longicornis]|uniref:GATA zinc finger domain-containing protein 14 n=1 Tax=Condylostylus longicornis TaxID=2530218 RepID=UPI00244DB16C|nr:GATA zinc finger domain-containing protein 14 [Condylostylus longicornis]
MDENKNSNSNQTTSVETFDSWTLVTENNPPQDDEDTSTSKNKNKESEPKKIEVLDNENLKLPEVNIEELSDGISVISESEMIDEYSERFSLVNENLYSNDSHTENESDTSLNVKDNSQTKIVTSNSNETNNQVSNELKNLFTVKKVASGFFYATLFVVILAFIGKIKVFHDMTSSVEISMLGERVGNLELHNNLLRAEIDILQKKVTYLANQLNLNTNQFNKNQKYSNQNQYNQQEQKANERSNDQNESGKQKYHVNNKSKKDVTSACEDNEKYVNGVCMVIEEYDVPNSKNNYNKEGKPDSNAKVHYQQNETPYIKYKKEQNEKFHNYKNNEYKNSNGKENYNSIESNENNDSHETDNPSLENKRDKKDGYYKNQNKKDRHNNGYNSKEYKYDKSKEYNKFDKKKHDNDWHDKLMDSRENFRKQKSKEKDNNWYVERGHSREEFRIFEDDDYKKKRNNY